MTYQDLYLDHAATAPMLPQAREAWAQGVEMWANPSSPHRAGRAARAALEDARARMKAALGWEGELVFTSGASEALALAITRAQAPLAAVSAVEHEAVLRHAGDALRLPVGTDGLVDPKACALAGLVAVQQVNNETGVIQPLPAIAEAVHGAGGVLLVDAAQGVGKLDAPVADLVALSAHKFGGPIGTGALLVRDWALLSPTGGQERGYRAGTENLPGVLAMVAALEAERGWLIETARLRARLDEAIGEAGGQVVAGEADPGADDRRLSHAGRSANAQLIRFDGMGIAVSAGSACSSGSLRTSHVLTAMGVEGANEVIRVSLGRETSEADVLRFASAWREIAGL